MNAHAARFTGRLFSARMIPRRQFALTSTQDAKRASALSGLTSDCSTRRGLKTGCTARQSKKWHVPTYKSIPIVSVESLMTASADLPSAEDYETMADWLDEFGLELLQTAMAIEHATTQSPKEPR